MSQYSFLEFFYSIVGLLLILFAFSFFFNDTRLFYFVGELLLAILIILFIVVSAFVGFIFAVFAANWLLGIFFLAMMFYFRDYLAYIVALFVLLLIIL